MSGPSCRERDHWQLTDTKEKRFSSQLIHTLLIQQGNSTAPFLKPAIVISVENKRKEASGGAGMEGETVPGVHPQHHT